LTDFHIASPQTLDSYRIIKRRIAWVIGKWVSEQCASPQNPRVWEILVHLLQEEGTGTDAVVQVTAAMALCDCVDVCPLTVAYKPLFDQTCADDRLRHSSLPPVLAVSCSKIGVSCERSG
jgi:hypothetical protein